MEGGKEGIVQSVCGHEGKERDRRGYCSTCTEGRGREKMGKESRALWVCGHRRERVVWCGVLLEKGRGVCGEGNTETAVFNHKLQN